MTVRNLDTGDSATLAEVSAINPELPEDPLALRDVEEVLETIVIRNLDTGEAMTMDRASGVMVPHQFAPVTRRSSLSSQGDSAAAAAAAAADSSNKTRRSSGRRLGRTGSKGSKKKKATAADQAAVPAAEFARDGYLSQPRVHHQSAGRLPSRGALPHPRDPTAVKAHSTSP